MTGKAIAPSFVVGIDLGTTNSVLAFADLREGASREIQSLQVPQWTSSKQFKELGLLPSFLFVPPDGVEQKSCLPWEKAPAPFVVGSYAREQAGLLPSRVVQSAKSWLSHPRIDREAPILPWGFDGGADKISPVQASSVILEHLKPVLFLSTYKTLLMKDIQKRK